MASACSLIIVIGVLLNLSRTISSVVETLEREQEIQRIAGDISLSMMQNVSRAFASMNTGERELYPEFASDCQKIRESIEQYQLLDLGVDEAVTVEEIKTMHSDLEPLMLSVTYARKTTPGIDLTDETGRIVKLAGDLDGLVAGLAASGSERVKTRLHDLREWNEAATQWTIAGGIISVIAFSIVGLLYTRRILSPLDELREAAVRVREGEFHIQVPRGRVSEINELSSSFNLMTDALRESEKRRLTNRLESIGILAGGIAHDFNNFLMSIYGSVNMIRKSITPGSPAIELLEEAEAAALRAKNLTRQLLTFARGSKPVKKPAVVQRVVRQAVEFARRGSAMRVAFSYPGDLWPAELDEGQVGQVFSNLAINAEQSMPGGGTLEVTMENVDVEQRSPLPLAPGPHVRVSVRDQGTGILPEHLPRIFDPYFTTKRRGSGLGLAVSQSVVTGHGGFITVESELGSGSVFHVHLPAKPGLKPDTAPRTETERPAGRGRVLVMDDEESILKVTGMLLTDLGHQPGMARSGEEALSIFRLARLENRPFEAVICDLVIPGGMGGVDLVRALKSIDPQTPVIATSGFTNDRALTEPEKYGFDGGLAKPFSIDELADVLAAVLSRKQATE
jgi:signal transduction histidine kinase/ActR/RegA family two-component response regulator